MTVLEEIDQIRAYLSGPGQPFELIEQDVLGQKLPVYRHVPKNLSTIVTSAAAYGDREFMVNGDQRITFAQALAKVEGTDLPRVVVVDPEPGESAVGGEPGPDHEGEDAAPEEPGLASIPA